MRRSLHFLFFLGRGLTLRKAVGRWSSFINSVTELKITETIRQNVSSGNDLILDIFASIQGLGLKSWSSQALFFITSTIFKVNIYFTEQL